MTDADFVWAEPERINTRVGSTLTRSKNSLNEIWWYKKPGYIDETVAYIKQVCEFTDSDSYVIETTSDALKNLVDTVNYMSVYRMFSDTMWGLLANDKRPRCYRYDSDYMPLHNKSDKSFFYNLTKLHQFYTDPPLLFRTPFSIGALQKKPPFMLAIHPGSYRLFSTLFLPENIYCCLLLPVDAHALINNLNIEFNKTKTILSINNKELIKTLNINLYSNLHISWSSQTGIQLVENHSELAEYAKQYEIKWTGRQFVVNDVIIATLKNNIFIPPGPIG